MITDGRNLQGEYKSLIKDVLTPALKKLGFKKNGQNFNRVCGDMTQCLSIQRSQFNHVERVLFTFNLGFYNDRLYKAYFNKDDEPKSITSVNCFLRIRLGRIVYDKDEWYEITLAKTYQQLYAQLKSDIDNHLIPFFEELNTLNSLIEVVRTPKDKRRYTLDCDSDYDYLSELEYGDFERGKAIVKARFESAHIFTSSKSIIVDPDGKEVVTWTEPSVGIYTINRLQKVAARYRFDL